MMTPVFPLRTAKLADPAPACPSPVARTDRLVTLSFGSGEKRAGMPKARLDHSGMTSPWTC